MTVPQRHRGVKLSIYPTVVTEDRRGNKVAGPSSTPVEIRAWIVPDRSSRAEVAGQQQINVYQIGTRAKLEDVDLYSRIHWDDRWWDVVTPPAHHVGTRHTQHWTLSIRQRPDDGGLSG